MNMNKKLIRFGIDFSWMTDSNFLAQMTHVLGGYGVILTAVLFSYNLYYLVGISLLFIVYAFLKEFWFDINYENPKQSITNGLIDFAFYCIGILIGWITVCLKNII